MILEDKKNYPYGLTEYGIDIIISKGLTIVATIETDKINDNSEELKRFFGNINKECKSKHIWILFGSNDDNDRKTWIPFQVASCTDVVKEIKNDFSCMFVKKNHENRVLKSYFDKKEIMKIECGVDTKCQKYRKVKNGCKYLAVAVLEDENNLKQDGVFYISKYQKAECDIACELKPLLWNPVKKEHIYVRNKF